MLMNGKLFFFILILFSLLSCEKEGTIINESECRLKMKDYFKESLSCKKEGDNIMYSENLYSGQYKGKTVYFVNVDCISCYYIWSGEVITCTQEKIKLKDLSEVSGQKLIYDACKDKFVD